MFEREDFVNAAEVAQVVDLPMSSLSVNPHQPRKHFGAEDLDQLAASIAAHGVLQPILVRQIGMGRYEIVVGERRFRAAQLAQQETVPAIVRELDDQASRLLALVENLQRHDLNPLEETDALLQLLSVALDKPLEDVVSTLMALNDEARGRARHSAVSTDERESVDRLFKEVGRFSLRSFVTHRLPLLSLPADLLEVVRTGHLEYTKVSALSRVKDDQERAYLLQEVFEHDLTLREVQARVAASKMNKAAVDDGATTLTLTYHYATLGKRLKRSPALQDERKRKRIQKLLEQLEKLLE
jgi:ParB family chromosome partitioning protein